MQPDMYVKLIYHLLKRDIEISSRAFKASHCHRPCCKGWNTRPIHLQIQEWLKGLISVSYPRTADLSHPGMHAHFLPTTSVFLQRAVYLILSLFLLVTFLDQIHGIAHSACKPVHVWCSSHKCYSPYDLRVFLVAAAHSVGWREPKDTMMYAWAVHNLEATVSS